MTSAPLQGQTPTQVAYVLRIEVEFSCRGEQRGGRRQSYLDQVPQFAVDAGAVGDAGEERCGLGGVAAEVVALLPIAALAGGWYTVESAR
ncbi:hypothetical protein ABZ153_10035 [Streptomyces sp. NPDC006290]|uniref:hypothetical protein n=1 Tax=Streptomyces sp. NPDC006290 TaxID=3156745 RepID=UPI0033A42642